VTTSTGVDVSSEYDLAPEWAQALERDGYVRLPNVLSAETVRSFEPEITAQVLELNMMHVPLAERSTYDKAFLQVTNLWQHSETVRELVFSSRLARIAATLLGVDGVRLYQDQALYKEPSGGITPWHADQYYWPLASDRAITVWIPLQDTPLTMGPLEFARGSHHVEFGRDLPIGDDSEALLQRQLAERDFAVDRAPYAIGDVSFHLGWTFHRAGQNTTDAPRKVMTIIYVDADIRVTKPINDAQQTDLDVLMPGAQVGEVPDTVLNPVLFRRRCDASG
jgi:ectoine hydroxylase-related dioxygenase (phytanoyl-CoA dioxygenase family)